MINITKVGTQGVPPDFDNFTLYITKRKCTLLYCKEKQNYLKTKLNPSFLKNFNSGTTLAVNLLRTILSLNEPDLTLGFVKEDWEAKLGSVHGSPQ